VVTKGVIIKGGRGVYLYIKRAVVILIAQIRASSYSQSFWQLGGPGQACSSCNLNGTKRRMERAGGGGGGNNQNALQTDTGFPHSSIEEREWD